MIDVNARIPADSNFQLAYGEAINERGEITGIGVPAGIPPADIETLGPAFLLIPCESNGDDWGDSVQLTTAPTVNATNATFRKAAAEMFNAFRAPILGRQHRGFRSLPQLVGKQEQ
jgi:hypothetical protein